MSKNTKELCFYRAFRYPVVAKSEREARKIIEDLCQNGDACNDIGDSDSSVTQYEEVTLVDGTVYGSHPEWFVERVSDLACDIENYRRNYDEGELD